MSDKPNKQFVLTMTALFVGAGLMVTGGMYDDTATQAAGASIIAAVVAVIGVQKMRGGGAA